jgi:hypothetical protein
MTCLIDTKSKRRLPAKLAAGLAISALLVLGAFVASSGAAEHRGGGDRGHADYRGGDRGRGSCCWGGGYYAAPPVVYAPYYAPPPVIYGPGIGIALPGININIP